jgi:predicted ester cyclase
MPETSPSSETQQQRNVAVVQAFIDGAVNGGDPHVIDQTWSHDMTWHGGSLGTFDNRDAFKAFTAANATAAFADMHLEIHEIIAHGDRVIARFTNSGRQVGPFLNNPPTGKHAEWLGIGIYTIRDGRITEGWFAEDILGMLLQLGVSALPGSLEVPTTTE